MDADAYVSEVKNTL